MTLAAHQNHRHGIQPGSWFSDNFLQCLNAPFELTFQRYDSFTVYFFAFRPQKLIRRQILNLQSN